MFVKDWMQAPATLLIADVPVATALRYLDREKAGHVVVIHHAKVVGVFSRNALKRALAEEGRPSLRPRRYLGDLDPPSSDALHPMDPIEQGARLMASRRTGALPVVDDGRVLGLLTASDVVRACATLLGAGEGGARVLVSGGRDADLLDTIARRSHGLVIRALTARRTPGGGWEAVLRLRGRLSSPRPEGEEQCA